MSQEGLSPEDKLFMDKFQEQLIAQGALAEALDPIIERQSKELLLTGVASRIIKAVQPVRIYPDPPNIPPLNESSNVLVHTDLSFEGRRQIYLSTESMCLNCPLYHRIADYEVGWISDDNWTLVEVAEGVETKDAAVIAKMAHELRDVIEQHKR